MKQTEQKPEKARVNYKAPFLSHPLFIVQAPRITLSVGILVTGLIYAILPDQLRFGPGWLLLALELALILPWWIFWMIGRTLSHRTARRLRFVLLGLVTAALVIALIFLVIDLHSFTSGFTLLRTAGLLWIFNVLVFAFWYWEVDGGGPHRRHERGQKAVDLLFPQQTSIADEQWAPDFFDYLFVAFTGATAFSPTDTYPLTHRAKALMMIEGTLSLMIVAILIGRVANIF